MPTQPSLRTARLILSPLRFTDIPRITEYAANENVSRFTQNIPHPYAEGDAVFWLNLANKGYRNGTHHVFAIRSREDEAFIGGIGLTVITGDNRATLGYWLAEPFWGRGYVSEAAGRMLRYGFENLGLNKVSASYLAENVASGRVMEKIGMTREGTLRQDILKNGVYHDQVYYGVLSSDLAPSSFPRTSVGAPSSVSS